MAKDKKALVVELLGDSKQLVANLTKTQKRMQKFGSAAKGIGKAVAATFAGIGLAAATVGKDMVMLASDANEAGSAFATTFEDILPKAGSFVEEFAHKAGFAGFELEALLTKSGAVLQGIEMTGEASFDLSKNLAVLSGDVASFSNAQGGAATVMDAMTKALLGETESLKTYGIAINQTDIQTQALMMTGKANAKELTKQEKAYATYELLLQKTTVQQGDLNRTQDSFANKTRQSAARIKDLKVQLGNQLLPIAEQLLPVIMNLVEQVGPSLVEAIKAAAPALQAIGELFALLLPPIIAVVNVILKQMMPAFQKFKGFIERVIAPFITDLPKLFENMINRIINGLNKFIDRLNSLTKKAAKVLKALGFDVDAWQISKIGNVDFGLDTESKKNLDDLDAQREAAAQMVGVPSVATNVGTSIPRSVTTPVAGLNTNVGSDRWGSGQQTTNYNVDIKTSTFVDEKKLGEEIVTGLKAYERSNGYVPINVENAQKLRYGV